MSGETGVVKFHCEHVAVDLAPFAGFDELNACRRKLLQLRMIGVGADGIAFGNVSVKADQTDEFYITGSGTGGRAQLALGDYARVSAYDFARNWVRCEGRVIASSESLTHAAVYDSDPKIRAVIHCHDRRLWTQLLEREAITSADVEYGTRAMAFEVQRLFRDTNVRDEQIFAMAGHTDGVVAFGIGIDHAFFAMLRAKARSS